MSQKTSTKKPAKATKKSVKSKAGAKIKPAATPTTKPGECPKGGSHEWTEEGNETYCSKCKEPKPKRGKAKAAKPAGETKMSALDAAAEVLGSSSEPLNTKAMIEAMAAKGLWTSPGGKTPHATLYSAIIREISVKGKESRFKKTDRGNFAFNG
ncbi:HTH domain-containing protein [Anatilimnocola floriformis]|uniref:HTH domain-containing protein n=1 Tax=Anatilimnocola floriformis TaxID=2948575 RepID=UPI0020C2A4C4|nr:HTH domain-containing protein [Anatilimnocola floriformis]